MVSFSGYPVTTIVVPYFGYNTSPLRIKKDLKQTKKKSGSRMDFEFYSLIMAQFLKYLAPK